MTAVSSRCFYVEQVHDVTVVCFTLTSIVETNLEIASDELFELAEYVTSSEPIQIVLDLWTVRKIDDWGLAMLRAFHETIESRGGKVIICRIPQTLFNALRNAGLWDCFHTCETRGEAILSYSATPGT
jgi:anti-anti-sigma regulatory factor